MRERQFLCRGNPLDLQKETEKDFAVAPVFGF